MRQNYDDFPLNPSGRLFFPGKGYGTIYMASFTMEKYGCYAQVR